jgi:hypothetical protein
MIASMAVPIGQPIPALDSSVSDWAGPAVVR